MRINKQLQKLFNEKFCEDFEKYYKNEERKIEKESKEKKSKEQKVAGGSSESKY